MCWMNKLYYITKKIKKCFNRTAHQDFTDLTSTQLDNQRALSVCAHSGTSAYRLAEA